MGTIIVIEDVKQLSDAILNYSSIIESKKNDIQSNNFRFNAELEKIVEDMFR